PFSANLITTVAQHYQFVHLDGGVEVMVLTTDGQVYVKQPEVIEVSSDEESSPPSSKKNANTQNNRATVGNASTGHANASTPSSGPLRTANTLANGNITVQLNRSSQQMEVM